MSCTLPKFALALACLAPAASADLWTVAEAGGPGVDFTDIQPAVNAAADGDTVLVQAGTYGAIVIDGKELTVQGDGEVIVIELTVFGAGGLRINNTAPDQSVVVRGIQFQHTSTTGFATTQVRDCAGPVLLEECSTAFALLPGPPEGPGCLISNSSSVTLARCDIFGAGNESLQNSHALIVEDSDAFVHDSTLTGGYGTDDTGLPFNPAFDGAPAVLMNGGRLFVSGSVLRGGTGGGCASISGCACIPYGNGGAGVRLQSGAPVVRIVDSVVEGGVGGSGGAECPPRTWGTTGADTVIESGQLLDLPGTARSLALSSPITTGVDVLSETMTGEPGDFAVLFFSVHLSEAVEFLAWNGYLHAYQNFILSPKGALPAGGTLVSRVAINPLGLAEATVYVQGVYVNAGGQAFLTGPSATTLMDPGR